MKNQAKNYEELVAIHLSMLTMDGRHLLSNAGSIARILKSDYLGELVLTNEEKGKYLDMLNETIEKYFDLMNQTLEERKQFSANQNQDIE